MKFEDLEKEKRKFDSVAYILYESDMARFERINKRLWILTALMSIACAIQSVLCIVTFRATRKK